MEDGALYVRLDLRMLVPYASLARLGTRKPPSQRFQEGLVQAAALVIARSPHAVCAVLTDLARLGQSESGRPLTADQAAQIATRANRIRAVISC